MIRAATVRSAARNGESVAFHTGRWCRWCPAFDGCPKQRELRVFVDRPEDDPELALATAIADDTDAPAMYEMYKRVGILYKRMGQSLHAIAASRPIPIGNGRFFGRREKRGNEKLDGDITYQVIRDLHGQEVADAAVIRTATKTRIDATLKGDRGAAKAVIAEVRKRDGITSKSTTSFEEFDGPPLTLVPGSEP